jgi:DNA-binding GntR family transcriptional regulator
MAVMYTVKSANPTIEVEKGDTLANAIRRQLADQIFNGEFPPNGKLDESELAARFGVSRTPIREALVQLDAAGLVEIRPRRGAVIVPIDKERIGHAFEAAAELEALAAGWAATRGTLIERKALERIHHEGSLACEQNDAEGFARINRHFHDKISEMARNPSLAEAVSTVRCHTAPFQKAQFARHEKIVASQHEHAQIVTAISFQDPETARRYMKEHILRASLWAIEEIA